MGCPTIREIFQECDTVKNGKFAFSSTPHLFQTVSSRSEPMLKMMRGFLLTWGFVKRKPVYAKLIDVFREFIKIDRLHDEAVGAESVGKTYVALLRRGSEDHDWQEFSPFA